MDDSAFDYLDFDIFGDEGAGNVNDLELALDATAATVGNDATGYLEKSQNYWQQVPLPADVCLDGSNVLASISDEILLGMSPSLIAHVQRSEASCGLQVVSPRAVTLGGLAARTGHAHRTTDMFLVGAAASTNHRWPTVEGEVPQHLFWQEPIDSYPSDPAVRSKTVSAGLVPSSGLIHDPITKAFMTGRALVDLQRRADVMGSAEALAAVLAGCWGIDADEYEDLAEATLAPTGPLLRYAIRSDDVYPVINAPVQARKCISVGANTAGRSLYGESSAIDWRRMRVLAESVFYQSSRLEGWTLAQMVLPQPPGNPRAPPDRAGLLQMRPLPGSVWTFDSATFKIDVDVDVAPQTAAIMPARVRAAVARYHEEVRPIARAADIASAVSFSHSLAHSITSDTGDALVQGYKAVLSKNAAFSTRGRTSVAAVRSFVYEYLAHASDLASIRALWLARYLHTTTEALNLTHLLDLTTTRHVASRLSDVTADLRAKLGVEAGRRGASLVEWWADFSAQLPAEIATMEEGSATWAIGLAHFLLHPPTSKWAGLVRAMAYASHTTLARAHLKDVRLPAKLGSVERSYQAGMAVARQLGTSYGAYYGAMYDVSCVLAARLRRGGNAFGAQKLLLAGMMWDIRAKAASTIGLHGVDGTSEAAGAFNTEHGRYHLTTAPYQAYQRWRKALNDAPFVTRPTKTQFPHHAPAILSTVYTDVGTSMYQIAVGSTSRMHRYSSNPSRLAADIEGTLAEIAKDVAAVMKFYDMEGKEDLDTRVKHTSMPRALEPLNLDMSRFMPSDRSYWAVVADLEPLEAADIVDAVLRMDNAIAGEIESRTYATDDELRVAVWGQEMRKEEASALSRDAVI